MERERPGGRIFFVFQKSSAAPFAGPARFQFLVIIGIAVLNRGDDLGERLRGRSGPTSALQSMILVTVGPDGLG